MVAQKFFPVEEPEGMYPLCERDYFARLDLICAKCDQALRSSYITACGKLIDTFPSSEKLTYQATSIMSNTLPVQSATSCSDPMTRTMSMGRKSVSNIFPHVGTGS